MSYLVIDTSKTMSMSYEPDTWSIAKVARDKLVTEASFADYDLRKVVAHATLYDRLLDEYYSTGPASPSPSNPSSPTKLAFDPSPEEKTITLEMKEDVHHGIVVEHAEHLELSLVKATSHSDNMTGSYSEVAVEEVENFEDS